MTWFRNACQYVLICITQTCRSLRKKHGQAHSSNRSLLSSRFFLRIGHLFVTFAGCDARPQSWSRKWPRIKQSPPLTSVPSLAEISTICACIQRTIVNTEGNFK